MSNFIPGLELSGSFYVEAVKPILETGFQEVRYGAALIGPGSEVLGFDTEMSADHSWGPRLIIFLTEDDYVLCKATIDKSPRQKLPYNFRGYSTNFSTPDRNDNNVRRLDEISSGEINHGVDLTTIRKYLLSYLGCDAHSPILPTDWLTFPEQKLRTIAAGGIFHDQIGLGKTLSQFSYYPDEVWLYLLASGWNRVSQEEHLMGRAGSVGDEIGSAIIAARLVRDLMKLCFLMEKQYAPYPK